VPDAIGYRESPGWIERSTDLPAIPIPVELRTEAAAAYDDALFNSQVSPLIVVVEKSRVEYQRLVREFQ